PAGLIEYRPGGGRLRPWLPSGARSLEPVARRMGAAALRPELARRLWRRLLRSRILRRRVPLLAQPLRLLTGSRQTARRPGLSPELRFSRAIGRSRSTGDNRNTDPAEARRAAHGRTRSP